MASAASPIVCQFQYHHIDRDGRQLRQALEQANERCMPTVRKPPWAKKRRRGFSSDGPPRKRQCSASALSSSQEDDDDDDNEDHSMNEDSDAEDAADCKRPSELSVFADEDTLRPDEQEALTILPRIEIERRRHEQAHKQFNKYTNPQAAQLQDRRLRSATLLIRGRTPEGQTVLVELVNFHTTICIHLTPTHHVAHPYPAEQELDDVLLEERKDMALGAWVESHRTDDKRLKALGVSLLRQARVPISHFSRPRIRASQGVVGDVGYEHDAYLEFDCFNFQSAKTLSRFIRHEQFTVQNEHLTSFRVSLSQANIDFEPISQFMYKMYNKTTMPWVQFSLDSVLEHHGAILHGQELTKLHQLDSLLTDDMIAKHGDFWDRVLEHPSCPLHTIRVRVPFACCTQVFKQITDEKQLQTLETNSTITSLDIEEFLIKEFNPRLRNAYVTSIPATSRLGGKDNDQRYVNAVQAFDNRANPMDPFIRQREQEFLQDPRSIPRDLLTEDGQLKQRHNAPPIITCVDTSTPGGPHGESATVCTWTSEEETLRGFFVLRLLVDCDILIGYRHTYYDEEALYIRACLIDKQRGRKASDKHSLQYLWHMCPTMPYWSSHMRRIDKENGQRQMANKVQLEQPFLLHIDVFDVVQESNNKFPDHTLGTVAHQTFKYGKVENNMQSMFYQFDMGHMNHELAYSTMDTLLPLELFDTWGVYDKYCMIAQQTCSTLKLAVECMQQARNFNYICLLAEERNRVIELRDAEAFQSLELADEQSRLANERFHIVSLERLCSHQEQYKQLTRCPAKESKREFLTRMSQLEMLNLTPEGGGKELRGRKTKKRTFKQILFNYNDIPDWELRRQAEATPDNPRIKGGMVQEVIVGMHKFVSVPDFNSLYPNIIETQQISIDKILLDKRYKVTTRKDVYKEHKLRDMPENNYIPCTYLFRHTQDKPGIYESMVAKYKLERRVYQDKEKAAEKAVAICEQLIQQLEQDLAVVSAAGAGAAGAAGGAAGAAAVGAAMAAEAATGAPSGSVSAIQAQIKELRQRAQQDRRLQSRFENYQLSVKLLGNSLFGFACAGRRTAKLPCQPIGACITAKGREFIMLARKIFEAAGFEVVYGDTDSLMLRWTRLAEMSKCWTITEAVRKVFAEHPEWTTEQKQAEAKRLTQVPKFTEQEIFEFISKKAEEIAKEISVKLGIRFELEKMFYLLICIGAKQYVYITILPREFNKPLKSMEEYAKLVGCKGGRGGARGDVMPFTKSTLKEYYKERLFTEDVQTLLRFLGRTALDLMFGRFPLKAFGLIRKLKKWLPCMVEHSKQVVSQDKMYDINQLQPHAFAVEDGYRKDPSKVYMVGERVTYVVRRTEPGEDYTKTRERAVLLEHATNVSLPDAFKSLRAEVLHLLVSAPGAEENNEDDWGNRFDRITEALRIFENPVDGARIRARFQHLKQVEQECLREYRGEDIKLMQVNMVEEEEDEDENEKEEEEEEQQKPDEMELYNKTREERLKQWVFLSAHPRWLAEEDLFFRDIFRLYDVYQPDNKELRRRFLLAEQRAAEDRKCEETQQALRKEAQERYGHLM